MLHVQSMRLSSFSISPILQEQIKIEAFKDGSFPETVDFAATLLLHDRLGAVRSRVLLASELFYDHG